MKKVSDQSSYVLGLDIGIASVGAALLADNHIISLHVRTFNKAETAKEGESLNKIRRDARSGRRRLRRRAFRLLRLRRLFKRTGLLRSNSSSEFIVSGISPWQLRAEGLDRVLSANEWAAVLYHMVKHRGFQSTRKSEAKSDEKIGEMLSSVDRNAELLKAGSYRTVGELAWKHEHFRTAKRNKNGSYTQTFARVEIEHELKSLFSAQRDLGNLYVSEQFEEDVYHLLMARRPALSGEILLERVGQCTFETEEKRIPKACYTAEKFVWLTKLNNLRISGQGKRRALSAEEREVIMPLAFTLGKVTYKQVRSKIKLSETERFVGVDYKKQHTDNDELSAEKEALFEAKHFHALRKIYKESGLDLEWKRDCCNPDRMDTLAYALTIFKEDEDSRKWLEKEGVESSIADAILNLSYSTFLSLSRKALLKIIPFMEQGQRYDEAVQSANYVHHSQLDRGKKQRFLPSFSKDDIANPVVYRALNQARKLVNAIIKKYGSPKEVHIELARDLSKPFKKRKEIEKAQKEFKDKKDKDIIRFKEQFGWEPKTKKAELVKWQLYREQDSKCAYSLKPLNLDQLFSNGYTEIDHVLPYSRSFDNSMNNKVLVLTAENRNKGNQTPYEYMNGNINSDWCNFKAFVGSNKKIRQAKRERLLRINFAEEAKEFRERNLTDTRYVCKLFKNHIESKLKLAEHSNSKRCVVVSGQLTAFLRTRWGLIKERSNGDLHHALDAAVVAACSHALVKRLSDYSRRSELEYLNRPIVDPDSGELIDMNMIRQLEKSFPEPWKGFRQELLARLSSNPEEKLPCLAGVAPVRVSRAVQRLGIGAAHEETIRSLKQIEHGKSSIKIPLVNLKKEQISNIVGKDDPRNKGLMDAITERLEVHNNDIKKAFSEPLYKPCKPGREASQVRSVRVWIVQKSGLLVRKGVAKNGNMLRIDLFTKGGKFFIVPVYTADRAKKVLPNQAVLANKPYEEWPIMDETYEFLFSLHKNDWVRISRSNTPLTEGYYKACDRSSGAIDIVAHDRNPSAGKDGVIRGIGCKTALSIEKFHVDMLGNLYPAPKKTRQPLL